MSNTQPDNSRSNRVIENIFIATVLILMMVAVYLLLGNKVIRFFAFDGPKPEMGQDNVYPLISALEKYKQDNGQYPPYTEVLISEHYLTLPRPIPGRNYRYEYDTFPSKDDREEYMLSFRAKWSIGGLYCYFSQDNQWIKSYFTCWKSPRPQKP